MKTINCKHCSATGLYWINAAATGKWSLHEASGKPHRCQSDVIKPVSCKYCPATDLHWGEEIRPDGTKKPVLNESYGLPHACDERIAFIAAEKQAKKDKYEAFKNKVNAAPDGKCEPCKGTGRGVAPGQFGFYCEHCQGHGTFNKSMRRNILAQMRNQIWPGIKQRTDKARGFDDVPF